MFYVSVHDISQFKTHGLKCQIVLSAKFSLSKYKSVGRIKPWTLKCSILICLACIHKLGHFSHNNYIVSVFTKLTVPFSQRVDDWKFIKAWLYDIGLIFDHIFQNFHWNCYCRISSTSPLTRNPLCILRLFFSHHTNLIITVLRLIWLMLRTREQMKPLSQDLE